MARDTYYPQQYINSVGQISKHYVWASRVDEARFTCPHNGEQLTYQNMYEEPDVQVCGIKTMTKDRIVMDRKKRSRTHFKKEILPTLPADEQKHFARKFAKE